MPNPERCKRSVLCLTLLVSMLLACCSPAWAQTESDLFFERINEDSGSPVEIDSQDKIALLSWMYRHLDRSDVRITRKNLPFLLAAALRNMYLDATLSYVSAGAEVFDYVKANPQSNIWGHCGTSVDFLMKSFAMFGITARQVSLFNTPSDSHVALEFFSETFQKYVFYDPLYGAFVVNSQGIPSSIEDIQEDISEFGFAYQNWRLRPLKLYGIDSSVSRGAASPQYEEYDQINYAWGLLRNYFNYIAVRRVDTTLQQTPLADEPEDVRGRWTMYDNSEIAGFPAGSAAAYKQQLMQAFDPRYHGRYHLHFMRGTRK